jgi:hypothetical protein
MEYITPIEKTLREISERLKKMTPAEFRESLVRAGIIDHEGNLTPQYAPPKKRKKSRSPKPESNPLT